MKKYIMDYEKLQKGDIVLSTGSGKAAKVIMAATDSSYSHAMICVHHSLIHAVPEGGVYSKNPQRLLFDSPEEVKVLRLRSPVAIEKMNKICSFARSLTCTLYSKTEAVSTKLYNNQDMEAKKKHQFCSRLVAQAYASEEIHLVNNPDYCTPEDINRSDLLDCVHDVVRDALPREISFAETPDPIIENQRVTLVWLKKARNLAKKNQYEIQSVNDAASFLCKYPELDEDICKYIIESGYLEDYQSDRTINPWRYNHVEFVNLLKNTSSSAHEVVRIELKKEPGFVDHFTNNYSINKGNVERTKLRYFELHSDLYKNNLRMAKDRLNVLLKVSNEYDCDLSNSISDLIEKIDGSLMN